MRIKRNRKLEDDITYTGDTVNGKKHGYGTITFHNGAKFSGNFVHGKRSGPGVFTFSDGIKVGGNWEDGVLVCAEKTI